MRLASRAVLATGLLLGTVALATVLVAASATAVVALVLGAGEGLPGPVRVAALVVAALLLVLLLVAVLSVVRPGRRPAEAAPAAVLDPQVETVLWREVRDLAAAVGAREPDEVVLVPDGVVDLHERSRLFGLLGGRRRLRLGAPLLMACTRAQLRAMVAHEIAHDSRRVTRFAPQVRRSHLATQRLVDDVVARLDGTARARWTLAWGDRLARTSSPVRREQEIAADRAAAEATSKAVLVAALRESAALAAAWAHFVDEFVTPAEATGRRPEAYFEGFAEVVEAPGLREVLESYRADPDEPAPPRHDAHPSFAERLALLEAHPEAAGRAVDDQTLALTILHDGPEVLHRLQEQMYAGSSLVPAPWPELLVGQDAPVTRARARVLYSAAVDVDRRPVTLGRLVDGIRSGMLEVYVRPLADHALDDRPTDAEVSRAATSMLTAAVVEALITDRGASVTRSWGAPPKLVDAEGEPLRADLVVSHAVAERDARALESWLEELGVDPDHRPEPVAGDEPDFKVLAVAAPVSGSGVRLVAVLHGGLLLRRTTWADRVTLLATAASPGSAMLRRFRTALPARLVEDPASRWHTWDTVERVEVRAGRGGMRLRVHVRDTRAVTIRFERATKSEGQVVVALAEVLGARMVHRG